MAANTTGHQQTDHLRTIGLVEAAYAFAKTVLATGGIFIAKVFQGGAEGMLLADMKKNFAKVSHYKPDASREKSPETYVVAQGFRALKAEEVRALPEEDDMPERYEPARVACAGGE